MQSTTTPRSCGYFVRRSTAFTQRRTIRPRATGQDDDNTTFDWDAAWSSFKAGSKTSSSGSNTTTTKTTEPPSFDRVRRPGDAWNSGPTANDIKRQEKGLLDAWTQESFSQLGIVAVLVLFSILLIVAGPPPSDGRCTLPWC